MAMRSPAPSDGEFDPHAPRVYDEQALAVAGKHLAALARDLNVSIGARIAGGAIGQGLLGAYAHAVDLRGRYPNGGAQGLRYALRRLSAHASELRWPGIVTPLGNRLLEGDGRLAPLSSVRLGVVYAIRQTTRKGSWETSADIPSAVPGVRIALALVAIGIRTDGVAGAIAATLLYAPELPDARVAALRELAERLRLANVAVPVYVDALAWPSENPETRVPEHPLSETFVPGEGSELTEAFGERGLTGVALIPEDSEVAARQDWEELSDFMGSGQPERELFAADPVEGLRIWTLEESGAGILIKVSDGTGPARCYRTSLKTVDRLAIVRIAQVTFDALERNVDIDDVLRTIRERGALEIGVTTRSALLVRLDVDMLEMLCCDACHRPSQAEEDDHRSDADR